MLKKLFFKTTFLLFLVFLILPSLFIAKAEDTGEFAQDEIVIKLKNEITQDVLEKLPFLSESKVSQKLLLPKTFILKVPKGQVKKLMLLISKNSLVEYAEPNYVAQAQDIIPNDPSFNLQWGLNNINDADIDAPEAWGISSGSATINIAVLDTGINQTHEDLDGKIGLTKDFTGTDIEDNYGHGTHVAGIAAAETNNTTGVAGTGFNSKIMVGKVLDNNGYGYYSWIADGIKWAADNNASVINLSLGGYSSSRTLENAVNYAWSKGVVIAAAAGNDNATSKLYPAAYTNVIAVAATDNNDKKASFSNFGNWVSVAAPGVNIYSTFPNHEFYIGTNYGRSQNYDYGSGTSMSTPFVSGTAALVWASGKCAPLNNTCVRNVIQSTADKIDKTGIYWQYGRINAFQAVAPSSTPTLTPTPTPIPVTPTPTPRSKRCQKYPWLCH